MNVRRGMLRMWVVATVIWFGVVAINAQAIIDRADDDATIRSRGNSGALTFEFDPWFFGWSRQDVREIVYVIGAGVVPSAILMGVYFAGIWIV